MSVKKYVLDGKFNSKVFIEEISDVFEILELTSHIIGILKFSSFGKIHSLENESHVVSVLKVTEISQVIAKLHAIEPFDRLLIQICH